MNTDMDGHNKVTLGLFPRNVPHVLEKIFFYLDYESYKKCHSVNSTWHELLTSDSYQKKAKAVFHEGIWKEEDKLWSAAKDGNVSEVKRLLTHLVDVNCVRGKHIKSTPLIEAAVRGHKIVTQMLLDKGANPNKGNMFGLTPLHYAAGKKSVITVKLLLEGGAVPNQGDNMGRASLWYAVGNKDVIKVLLDAGADPNKRDRLGSTPLHRATRYSNKNVIQLLLDAGADLYTANN